MESPARRLATFVLAAFPFALAGCQGVPTRSAPPTPNPVTPIQVPASSTTSAVVEATVTAVPQGRTRVVYRVAFIVPKGVSSISLVLPDLAPEVPVPTPAAAPGEAKECGGFFGCSKFVAETVSAVIAAIVALFGLLKLLRGRRKGKR